jgi:hypothetical protein
MFTFNPVGPRAPVLGVGPAWFGRSRLVAECEGENHVGIERLVDPVVLRQVLVELEIRLIVD